MVTTSDPELWRRAWSYKDHGKDWDAVHRAHPPGFRWLHESFGSNWRLTEPQSAIGRVQLRKLPAWIAARRAHAAVLDAALADLPAVRVPVPAGAAGHAYYKYYCFIRPDRLRPGWDRDRVMREVEALGVPCGVGACPAIWREAAFARASIAPPGPLPVAEALGMTSLMLQVHPTLDAAAIGRTAATLRRVLEQASA